MSVARINGEIVTAPESAVCYDRESKTWVMSLSERRKIEREKPSSIIEITDIGYCGGCGCDVLLDEAIWNDGNCYCDGCDV